MDNMNAGYAFGDIGTDADNVFYSYSDAGEPKFDSNIPPSVTNDGDDIEKLDFSPEFSNPNGQGADSYTGTNGEKDVLKIYAQLNAPQETIDAYQDYKGDTNWKGISGLNDKYHAHWVESFGPETFENFSGTGGDGDKIAISGHNVNLKVIEEDDNSVEIGVYVDQGRNGSDGYKMTSAHDFDVVGTVSIEHDGNFDFEQDVNTYMMGYTGVDQFPT